MRNVIIWQEAYITAMGGAGLMMPRGRAYSKIDREKRAAFGPPAFASWRFSKIVLWVIVFVYTLC